MRIKELSSGIFLIKDKASFIMYSEGMFGIYFFVRLFVRSFVHLVGLFHQVFRKHVGHLFVCSFVHLVIRLIGFIRYSDGRFGIWVDLIID